jgi:hypothetical protein
MICCYLIDETRDIFTQVRFTFHDKLQLTMRLKLELEIESAEKNELYLN